MKYVQPLKKWEDLYMDTEEGRFSWFPSTCCMLRDDWANFQDCHHLSLKSNEEIKAYFESINNKSSRYPVDYDSLDWRYNMRKRWWHKYVCARNCHAMAKHSLYIMSRVEPEVDWQIVSSDEHSTCWDGGHRIFDMNYMAITDYSAVKTFTVAGGVLYNLHPRQTCP